MKEFLLFGLNDIEGNKMTSYEEKQYIYILVEYVVACFTGFEEDVTFCNPKTRK